MSTTQPTMICMGENGDGCGRPMRRRGVKIQDAPGTVAIGHSGKCKSCVSSYEPVDKSVKAPSVPKAEDPQRMSKTVSDLEAWLNRNRGVAREAKNPIRYRAGEQDAA